VVMATISFYMVEEPVRRSSWLEPRAKGRNRQLQQNGLPARLAMSNVVLIFTATLAIVLVVVSLQPRQLPRTEGNNVALLGGGEETTTTSTSPQEELTVRIQLALEADEWPQLTPGLDVLAESKANEWVVDGCLAGDRSRESDPIENAAGCVFGSPEADKTAVLLGDSVAISYAPGIRAALEPLGWQVRVVTMALCPAMNVPVNTSGDSVNPACPAFRAWGVETASAADVDLVILASSDNTQSKLVSKATGEAALQEMRLGTESLISALAGRPVAILSPAVPGMNLQTCATNFNSPRDCVSDVGARINAQASMYSAIASDTERSVTFVDTRSWFCVFDKCPSFVNGVAMHADGLHLTDAYARGLGPMLAAALPIEE